MVHVENAPVAGGAMMAALRLENIAHQAVTTSFVLRVTEMEAPKDWHLSRICSHRLHE
jgi:hypothetical protein